VCVCVRIPCDLYEHCCGHCGSLSPTHPEQMKLVTPFTSSEKERRLKFYLIKGDDGGLTVPARGCKHERRERLVCVFVVFCALFSLSRIRRSKKKKGPPRGFMAPLELLNFIFTNSKNAKFGFLFYFRIWT